ncbi:hypothetical protein GCM10023353_10900 [Tomitella cavernea]|uniref:Uncharacterized protein n=1 Tax=Tomitella cavernea TaxID=1387982 RepID=A0ABP9CEX5_9ACTN
MREPVGALVHLRVGAAAVAGLDGDPIRHEVYTVLDEVSDIQGHTTQTRTCYGSRQELSEIHVTSSSDAAVRHTRPWFRGSRGAPITIRSTDPEDR